MPGCGAVKVVVASRLRGKFIPEKNIANSACTVWSEYKLHQITLATDAAQVKNVWLGREFMSGNVSLAVCSSLFFAQAMRIYIDHSYSKICLEDFENYGEYCHNK